MNEEEIINILTDDIVALNVGYVKYEEAVQGLLNLYNKEKERNKDLEQILELTSKSLDNISYDQIPIAIEELKFKLQDLKQIEQEHKEENGRLREENKILRHGLEENTEEIDKLYKIINDMANEIYITAIRDDGTHFSTTQEVIDYFTNKVEEDK